MSLISSDIRFELIQFFLYYFMASFQRQPFNSVSYKYVIKLEYFSGCCKKSETCHSSCIFFILSKSIWLAVIEIDFVNMLLRSQWFTMIKWIFPLCSFRFFFFVPLLFRFEIISIFDPSIKPQKKSNNLIGWFVFSFTRAALRIGCYPKSCSPFNFDSTLLNFNRATKSIGACK